MCVSQTLITCLHFAVTACSVPYLYLSQIDCNHLYIDFFHCCSHTHTTHARHHCQLMGTLWRNGTIKTSIYIFFLGFFLDFWSKRFYSIHGLGCTKSIFIAIILLISIQWYLLWFAIAQFVFVFVFMRFYLIGCQKIHHELRKIFYNFNRLKIMS